MKHALLNILTTEARGAGHAIKAKALADEVWLPEREVRALIRELIGEGHAIASSTQPPYGFYLAVTAEEKRRYAAQLRSRIAEMAKRLRDFEAVEKGQMEMF